MAVVTIEINGRPYQIACGDGEEEHVRHRAAELDKRVRILASQVGQVGEAVLLTMTGLLLEDELHEVRKEARAAAAPVAPEAVPTEELDAALAAAIEALAARIDGIAERLETT